MTEEPQTPAEEEEKKRLRAAIDRALKALLVDDVHIDIDPATGDVESVDGQTPFLTDEEDVNTIR